MADSKILSLLKMLVFSVSPGLKKTVRSQAIFQRISRSRNRCHRSPKRRKAGSSLQGQSETLTRSDHSVRR